MSGFLNRWRALIGVRSTGASVLLVLFLISLPIITPRIRGADEIEYFSYLHSLWIDGDLEFGNEYQYFYDRDPAGLAAFKSTFLDRLEPTGHHINFGPIGSALLWSPIYLLVHAGMLLMRACGGSVVADGFSRPYEIAACYTSVTYGFTGLLLIYHALKRSGAFSERAATGSVIALWWGSPVLYYMTIAPGFSHATSLFAVSLLLWLWLRARQSAALALRTGFVLGLAGGLAGLVREQDVFFVVIPAIDALAQGWRCRRIARSLRHVTAMVMGTTLAMVPQLLAYKAINGTFGPSASVKHKTNLCCSPHFFEVLIDPGHGLFLWSPLLLLAVIGLFALAWRRRQSVPWLLLLAFFIQVWINGAVESWHQAGAFGSRRFIGATFVFAWGLAAVTDFLLTRKRRWLALAMVLIAIWWNVSLMIQFGLKLMDRQQLEWPRVAQNQIFAVPPRLAATAYRFLVDRERLVKQPQ